MNKIKISIILMFFYIISYSQEINYSFIDEIKKETPNLYVADSLYKIEVSKITGERIKPYSSFIPNRKLGQAFNDYYHWRNENAYFADRYGDIRKNKNVVEQSKSSNRSTNINSQLTASTTTLSNVVDWKIQTSNVWNFMGPYETNTLDAEYRPANVHSCVLAIDRSRSNPDVLACAVQESTIFKSIDKGNNWFAITNELDVNDRIQGVKIHPLNEDIIAFTSNTRIYATQDGGLNWVQGKINSKGLPSNNLSEFNVPSTTEIEIIPNSTLGGKPQIIVTGSRGIYELDIDTGKVSQYANLQIPAADIKMHPINHDIIYILGFEDIDNRIIPYKSTDRGNTWVRKDGAGYLAVASGKTEILKSAGGRIGLSQSDENLIYVYLIGGYSSSDDLGFIGLYRSNDGGDNWTLGDPLGPGRGTTKYNKVTTGVNTHVNVASDRGVTFQQGFYNSGITVNPLNHDEVVLGGIDSWKTSDSGLNWTRLSGNSNYDLHSDFQAANSMIVNGITESFVTNDGGIIYSENFFSTQPKIKSYGLPSDFWGLDVGLYHNVIVGGRYHNGDVAYYETFSNPLRWKDMGGSESSTGLIYLAHDERAVHFQDTDDGLIPLTTNGLKDQSTQELNIAVRQDQNVPSYGAKKTLSGNFFHFNKDNNRQICKIYDVGRSMFLHEFSSDTHDMEVCPKNENYIYVTTKNGTDRKDPHNILQRTTDGGMTWNIVHAFTEDLDFRIQVDDQNPDHVWLYGQDSSIVYESKNGGTTFNSLSTPPGDISELLHQWSSNNMYAFLDATNMVYRYEIDTDTWHLFNSGLPKSSKPIILKIMYSENKLILDNKGMGLWQTDLHSVPSSIPTFISVSSDKTLSIDKLDLFKFESESYTGYTPTFQWSTNAPNASIATATSKNTEITFNDYGIFDVTLDVYDGSTIETSIVKKIYVYPGCSFDGITDNVLIPLKEIGLWIKGDDQIKTVTDQGYDNILVDLYSKEHSFYNGCASPLQVENYNGSEFKAISLSNNNFCRIDLDKEYTEGKTFFFVGHNDPSGLNRSRPYFGHKSRSDFDNNNKNILNSTSKVNFDLVKLNGLDVTASVTSTNRPITPGLTVFRVKNGSDVAFQTISRNLASGSERWFGEIAEVIVYNYRLSDSEIQIVENYLMTKYKLTP